MPTPSRTVTFRVVEGLELKADIYEGDRAKSTGIVLWFHGGGLILLGRRDIQAEMLALCQREGIPLVSVDYRLAPQASIADIHSDVEAAFRWVQAEAAAISGSDQSRVLVAGLSAGGYIALSLGLLDHGPTAIVSYYGYGTLDSPWYREPSTWYRDTVPVIDESDAMAGVDGEVVADGQLRPDGWKFYIHCRQQGIWPTLAAGVPFPEGRDILRRYSPAYQVTEDFPPTMLLHGTVDNDVPHAESVAMDALLQLHRVEHEFISLEGLDHGLEPGEDPRRQEAVKVAHAQVDEFILRHIGS